MLNVPGEDLDKVIHYYKEPHPYYNHDVLVVGAKNSAAIARAGAVLDRRARHHGHRGAGIPPNVKYWIARGRRVSGVTRSPQLSLRRHSNDSSRKHLGRTRLRRNR